MKKIFPLSLIIALVCFGTASFAQIENPVKWNTTSKKTGDKKYEVVVSATIAPGWHLYAQEAGDGPEPTTLQFTKNPLINFEGKTKEVGKLRKEYDKNFDTELKFYDSKVDFVQALKMKAAASTLVKGNVTYMVCNDRKCLPPKTIPISVKIAGK